MSGPAPAETVVKAFAQNDERLRELLLADTSRIREQPQDGVCDCILGTRL